MAVKIDKKYQDLCLMLDNDEVQKELKSSSLTQSQINDVFNLITEFFSRYFDKGDFLSRRRYGGKNHYIIPYNGEDVLLHWANHDQYYVKTDRHFKNYSFKVGNLQVSFKIKKAETESNNNKGKNKYFILADERAIQMENSHGLTIWFQYRTLSEEEKKKYGTRSIQDEFLKEVIEKIEAKNNGLKAVLLRRNGDESSLLETHLKRYVNENTHDFFIHKNLRGFLNRELEFFIKNEILDFDEMESMDEQHLKICIAKAKAIRGICQKIIEFLAQIEEFQKKLFEKKKFVIRTDYCMTLDKVPEEFYAEIGRNVEQVEEWKYLFKLELSKANRKTLDVDFLKSHKSLVLDTKFFPLEFKDRLLTCFESLDEEIGGLIIKSENFQALNLLAEKYRGKVKCIYIDPPYNTENDEFIYKDNYQHSSWLSMMANRLKLGGELMREDGAIFVSIDDHERKHLENMLASHFGDDSLIGPIVVQVNKGGRDYLPIAKTHEYLICCAIGDCFEMERDCDVSEFTYDDSKGKWIARELRNRNPKFDRRNRPNLYYPIYVNPNRSDPHHFCAVSLERTSEHRIEVFPRNSKGEDSCWRWGREKISKSYHPSNPEDSEVIAKQKADGGWNVYEKFRGTPKKAKSVWDDSRFRTENGSIRVRQLFGVQVYDFPKPVELIEEIFIFSAETEDLFLDFFAGSGTTAHAVLSLNQEDDGNRKYILVEMGDYFDTVMKPRIQKVIYSKDWKDGRPVSNEGISHIFKYQYLEQYEDTLNNIIFSDFSKTAQETLDGFDDYFLKYMLNYETRESPARLTVKQFGNPFDYKLKVTSGGEERIETVDLVETFNYLLGLEVERIRVFEDKNRKYRVIFGRKGENKIVVIWRSIEGFDQTSYTRDKEFIEKTILRDERFDSIYINGDSLIPGAEPIEPEFKRLMGA